jgi:elongation factor Ts
VLRRCAVVRAGTGELVNAYVHTVTNKIAVLVRLRGSADDPDHVSAARNVAMHIAASKPEFVCRADVPAGTLERERQVLAEKTRAEGKPETALPKIVEGRLGRFYEQTCAVEQPYVRDPSVKVGEMLRRAGVELLEYRLYVVGQE